MILLSLKKMLLNEYNILKSNETAAFFQTKKIPLILCENLDR